MRGDARRRFEFRLAAHLHRTIAELRATISADEFDQWALFYRLEPWGEWRADYRAGLIAATIYNMNRGKDADALSPHDFMPLIERPPAPPKSTSDLRAALMAWFPPKPRVAD